MFFSQYLEHHLYNIYPKFYSLSLKITMLIHKIMLLGERHFTNYIFMTVFSQCKTYSKHSPCLFIFQREIFWPFKSVYIQNTVIVYSFYSEHSLFSTIILWWNTLIFRHTAQLFIYATHSISAKLHQQKCKSSGDFYWFFIGFWLCGQKLVTP